MTSPTARVAVEVTVTVGEPRVNVRVVEPVGTAAPAATAG